MPFSFRQNMKRMCFTTCCKRYQRTLSVKMYALPWTTSRVQLHVSISLHLGYPCILIVLYYGDKLSSRKKFIHFKIYDVTPIWSHFPYIIVN